MGFSVDSPGASGWPHLRGHLAGLTGSDLTDVSLNGDVFLLWSPYKSYKCICIYYDYYYILLLSLLLISIIIIYIYIYAYMLS